MPQANLWLPGFEPADCLFPSEAAQEPVEEVNTSTDLMPVTFTVPAEETVCSDMPPIEATVSAPTLQASSITLTVASASQPDTITWPLLSNDAHAGLTTVPAKFEANVRAIRTLKQLEESKTAPDVEQRIALNRYTGWGGIKAPFDLHLNYEWAGRSKELRDLLSEDEFKSAGESILNAHFTPLQMSHAIWALLKQLGFTGGRVLEPAAGVGNFVGTMPTDIARNSSSTLVEIDTLSARMLKVLYGHEARVIQSGLEKVALPESHFDLVIGNVPFGKYGVADLRRKYYSNWSIHNWFLAHSIELVRPGGLVAVITSSHFMDSSKQERRKAIANRAKLLAAYRLPSGVFSDVANTDVVADLLIFQRREPGEWGTPAEYASWVPQAKLLNAEGQPIRLYQNNETEFHSVNTYWNDHREHVLGYFKVRRTQYGARPIVDSPTKEDVYTRLGALVPLVASAYVAQAPESREVQVQVDLESFKHLPTGSLIFTQGEFRKTTAYGSFVQPMKGIRAQRAQMLIGIRDTLRQLLAEQASTEASEQRMDSLRLSLNRQYDQFVAKFGAISTRGNAQSMAKDPSWPLLLALEVYDEETQTASKADIFVERTTRPTVCPTSADNIEDALAISIAELGGVDLSYIGKLICKEESEVSAELLTSGCAYINPETMKMESASSYLSGNVRDKLAIASMAGLPFDRNVNALTAVMPEDLLPTAIDVIPGNVWIPESDHEEFLFHILGSEIRAHMRDTIEVKRDPAGIYTVSGPFAQCATLTATWGTSRINGYQLFCDQMNLKDSEVRDLQSDGSYKINPVETAQARQKQEDLKQAFKDWIWTCDSRTQRLVRVYNDRFNCWAKRKFDGSKLRLPGFSSCVQLRSHQLNAIARIATGDNTMLAHVVGAGKTLTMIGGTMELRRLGLVKKPVHVVPNHCLMQYTAEFCRAYPNAKVLMATKEDFEKANRQQFVARCATGNWDAVIITHSMFERITCDADFAERHIQGIIDELSAATSSDRTAQRNLVRQKKDWQARLEKMQTAWKKDTHISFSEVGFDHISFDEAHLAKNLYRVSSMKQVAGMSSSNSQRSFDLMMKTKQVMSMYKDEGKGVVFATGTPVSNSLFELNTFSRFLQPHVLEKMGLGHVDAWVGMFGRVVNSLEVSPDGSSFRMNKRFKQFVNMPELMGMVRQCFDIQTKEMLKLPTPPLVTGTHQIGVAAASPALKTYVASLVKRAEYVRDRKVQPHEDNMLAITGDGMRAALDLRLVDPNLYSFDPNGKVSYCLNNVYEMWKKTTLFKGTQLVFCDLGTPTGKSFNVYGDMKARLIGMGIPAHEIAFIHDADSIAAKAILFAKVRAGSVRIVIGSTMKMGFGTNVQRVLYAVHHLTTPWRPSDIEQRDGRIERQGNLCEAIEIWRYVTEGSFDSYMWQTLTSKASFIAQVMSDQAESRTVEDAMMAALSYDEVKALACGNPRVREKAIMDAEILTLGLKEKQHRESVWNAKNELWKLPTRIHELKHAIVDAEKFLESVKSAMVKEPALIVNGKFYRDVEQIAEIMTLSIRSFVEKKISLSCPIGGYAGGTLVYRNDWRCSITLVNPERSFSLELGNYTQGKNIMAKLHDADKQVQTRVEDLYARLEYLTNQEPILAKIVEGVFAHTEKLADLRKQSTAIAVEMGLLKNMSGTEAMDSGVEVKTTTSIAMTDGDASEEEGGTLEEDEDTKVLASA